MANAKQRCEWCDSDPLMIQYHDEEWGVPTHGDDALFELLTLEGAQAGLSWRTILHKRTGYREVFRGFDVEAVARMNKRSVERLMSDARIVRNRLKIESTISNAKAILRLRHQSTSFDDYVWQFVDGQSIINRPERLQDLPAKTALSDKMSKDLKRRGFRFVGSTICYAFMQAAGLVNDHTIDCFKYGELSRRICRT